jgi:hypothetical protein
MTLIIKGGDILQATSNDQLTVDSKNNFLSLDTTSLTSNVKKTNNYSEGEIQELVDAIKSTISEMGGNPENPEPKYLKYIGKHADCYWTAIEKFLEGTYSTNIVNKIVKAFSSMNLIEGVTAEKMISSVDLVNKIFAKNINAVSVNWFYPTMSKVSLYKDTIKHFNDSILNAYNEYWNKYSECNGDDLELLDFKSELEDRAELSDLFKDTIIQDSEGEIFKIKAEIYQQILPSYMQRLITERPDDMNYVISSFYIVFNWDLFTELKKIQDAMDGKEFQDYSKKIKYEPRLNSLLIRK